MLTDEMLMRSSTEEQMGLAGLMPLDQVVRRGRILVIEDQESPSSASRKRCKASSS